MGPGIVSTLRGAGQFRVNIKHELVPDGWYESEFYETLLEPFRIEYVICTAAPLDPDVESWCGFQRRGEKSRFGETEREILAYAVRPMTWFHRRLLLHHGVLLATEPMTPSERRVLNGLLTEKTEQEIANDLHLTQNTAHTYGTRIYRKLNVRGCLTRCYLSHEARGPCRPWSPTPCGSG